MSLVFRDAFWQIGGRVISALAGFLVVKLITPYLGPLRYGDYSTILKYFAIWSALADFGIYVLALNMIGKLKSFDEKLKLYHKFLGFRFFMVISIYFLAFIIALLIPSYSGNPFILYGLVIGMLFSATFMLAGIVQLPLQLHWNMKEVSVALILARISQIVLLLVVIFVLFPNVDFSKFSYNSLLAFILVLFSVFLSGIVQYIYVWSKGKKYMTFKLDFDKKFILKNLKTNWKYGFSYYLSSFHTLIVLIFLSILFPTKLGFNYVGLWALALALIEILLIVPSAFGNSIIHKISSYEKHKKLRSLGYFLIFIIWFGFLLLINFILFKTEIVSIIAGNEYLSIGNKLGSDFLLPFLAFVLFLSFIKQVFNYVLVSFEKQNLLFAVNLFGVIVGVIIGIILIPKYDLIGGLITQIILEVLFVLGVIIVVKKNKIFPYLNYRYIFYIFILFILFTLLFYFIKRSFGYNLLNFFILAFIFNTLVLIFSYKFIRYLMKKI